MRYTPQLLLALILIVPTAVLAQGTPPKDFVKNYYAAYSGVPTAARLSPFYANDAVIDDPTYDWIGKDKATIFQRFDVNNAVNYYQWRIDNVIEGKDGSVVTEGELSATYKNIPYKMRFVNIFVFNSHGLIRKQYDYFDNADYFKAVEASKK
jgi:hypothetical protein